MSNTGRSFFDQNFIEEVRAAVSIVEVVGESVALRQRGRNHVGLCPFHTEKTPSFTVSPEKGIFHCFGCGAGGDAFSFVQKRDGLSFPEAVRLLADRAGIPVPEREVSPAQARRQGRQEELHRVLELAAAHYQRSLWAEAARPAREYLRRRGFGREILERFRVGWAPPGWDGLAGALRKRGVPVELLIDAGLAARTDDGRRVYDRFRGRVMFPIGDSRGRTVAFGGRLLPGSPDEDRAPKYLNSPETELFSKGRQLYAWHLTRAKIRERGAAVVVEGYVDVLTCHRAGFEHAVASLGTALTARQGRLLLTQAKRVLVAYDADAAGQGATQRGMDVLAGLGADIRIVTLRVGKDPDECISQGGKEAFADSLDNAQDYVEYRFGLAQAEADERYGAGSARAAAAVVEAIAPTLAALDSQVAREAYVQGFARRLGVGEGGIWREVRRAARDRGAGRTGRGHTPGVSRDNKGNAGTGLLGAPAHHRAQEQLCTVMLADPASIETVRAQLRPEEFPDEPYRSLVRAIYEAAAGGAGPGPADSEGEAPAAGETDALRHSLLRSLETGGQDKARAMISRLAMVDNLAGEETKSRVCRDCIRVLQEHSRSNRIIEVRQEVQRLEREGCPVPSRLLEEYTRLIRAAKGGPPPMTDA